HALRQIARIALFGGHRDDLAAELEGRADPGRRKRRPTDPPRAAGVPRPGFWEIGGDADLEARRARRRRIEQVQVAGLLEDDLAAAGGGAHAPKVAGARAAPHS